MRAPGAFKPSLPYGDSHVWVLAARLQREAGQGRKVGTHDHKIAFASFFPF
ncbi:MAG: hypothetical protein QOG73_2397 [Acetobacteraceae bacterium]|jgi:hypothetical protein|nr:hypothetical protein [Acetobacteraceae bacterium]